MSDRPHIENAPGLSWREIKSGWIATWRARSDLIARGFRPKNWRLWSGTELTPAAIKIIQDACNGLQTEMLIWGRGGIPVLGTFDGSIRALSQAYKTDADSPYLKTRYRTRIFYQALMRRIDKDCGDVQISEIKARTLLRWHEVWAEGKQHIPRAHALIGMLRTLINFGASFLEDENCERLSTVLHRMKFEQGKARVERLTADQATAIRSALRAKRPSMSLAQALQFDLMLRQKDVIGEWVPLDEPGMSAVIDGNRKWLRGLRWDEIDANWILKHTTSKRQKEIVQDLKLASMVVEELQQTYPGCITIIEKLNPKTGEVERRIEVDRSLLPASGPVIVAEGTGLPWSPDEFRRIWRKTATECDIPKAVRNMDSRSGAITEALEAGASLDAVRKSATHSDAQMTQRYSRGDAESAAEVSRLRVAHRNKSGTSEG